MRVKYVNDSNRLIRLTCVWLLFAYKILLQLLKISRYACSKSNYFYGCVCKINCHDLIILLSFFSRHVKLVKDRS